MRQDHKLNQSAIRWIAFSAVLVLSGILACDLSTRVYPTPTPSPRNAWLLEWLDNPPCQPPCFLGITPGVTTITETVQILSDQTNIQITDGPGSMFDYQELSWRFANTYHDSGRLQTDLKGQAVTFIILGIDNSEDLKLSEVIAAFGEPDQVTISRCPKRLHCDVFLIYNSSGMLVELYLPAEVDKDSIHNVNISPDLLVEIIWFIPSGEKAFKKAFVGERGRVLMNWEGYTTYQEK